MDKNYPRSSIINSVAAGLSAMFLGDLCAWVKSFSGVTCAKIVGITRDIAIALTDKFDTDPSQSASRHATNGSPTPASPAIPRFQRKQARSHPDAWHEEFQDRQVANPQPSRCTGDKIWHNLFWYWGGRILKSIPSSCSRILILAN